MWHHLKRPSVRPPPSPSWSFPPPRLVVTPCGGMCSGRPCGKPSSESPRSMGVAGVAVGSVGEEATGVEEKWVKCHGVVLAGPEAAGRRVSSEHRDMPTLMAAAAGASLVVDVSQALVSVATLKFSCRCSVRAAGGKEAVVVVGRLPVLCGW